MADIEPSGTEFKLTDRDVRLVYLPPMTIASVRASGQDENGSSAESVTAKFLDTFISEKILKRYTRPPGTSASIIPTAYPTMIRLTIMSAGFQFLMTWKFRLLL